MVWVASLWSILLEGFLMLLVELRHKLLTKVRLSTRAPAAVYYHVYNEVENDHEKRVRESWLQQEVEKYDFH